MMSASNSTRRAGFGTRCFHLFATIGFLLSSCGLLNGALPTFPLADPGTLDNAIIGEPVVAGSYLFWLTWRESQGRVLGHNRPRQHTFVVAPLGSDPDIAHLTSDGETVAWLDRQTAPPSIRTYDLRTRRAERVRFAEGAVVADLALHRGVLYVWNHAPTQRGIYAYWLVTGRKIRLSSLPRSTVQGQLAVDGTHIVWSEHTDQGDGLPPRAALYMADLTRPGIEYQVMRGQPWSGALAGFALAGDYVVWSCDLERQIWLAKLSTGQHQVISTGQATYPIIQGNRIAWQHRAATARQWGVTIYDLDQHVRKQVITGLPTRVRPWGFTSAAELVFTSPHRPDRTAALYHVSLAAHRLPIIPASAPAPMPPQNGPPQGGQVRVVDQHFELTDAPGQPWTFNGVHVIFPSHGINGSSFNAAMYHDVAEIAERHEWLDRAQLIAVQTVRIYVDMPGDSAQAPPPLPEQIYRFAVEELSPRGMRLGLVIHNSGLFDDPDGQKMAWLTHLLDCFGGTAPEQGMCQRPPTENHTHLLAYINADNEINIHRHPIDAAIPGHLACRPDNPNQQQITEDCFDHPNQQKRQQYIQAAIKWVDLVRQTVKQHPTGQAVLLTVGMSVDMEADILGDGQSAVLNYFVDPPDDGQPPLPSLADLVDFLAPHSYTAQPIFEIVEPINRVMPFFAKPILLEEFGYPTDPIVQPNPQSPAGYKETSIDVELLPNGNVQLRPNSAGLPPGEDWRKLCRYCPKMGTFNERPGRCNPSAPYVVQINLETIFDTREVAGGIAFMLADNLEKGTGSTACYADDPQRQVSKNLFLGLFAVDTDYPCGGTVNIGRGQIKNTGYRVCVAYHTGNPQLGDYDNRVVACELDL